MATVLSSGATLVLASAAADLFWRKMAARHFSCWASRLDSVVSFLLAEKVLLLGITCVIRSQVVFSNANKTVSGF